MKEKTLLHKMEILGIEYDVGLVQDHERELGTGFEPNISISPSYLGRAMLKALPKHYNNWFEGSKKYSL